MNLPVSAAMSCALEIRKVGSLTKLSLDERLTFINS